MLRFDLELALRERSKSPTCRKPGARAELTGEPPTTATARLQDVHRYGGIAGGAVPEPHLATS
jgi:hypothetical protein